MSIKQQKQRIIEQVTSIEDTEVLRQIEDLLGSSIVKEPVVAYGAKGEPMTKKDFIQAILESKEDLANGDYLSQEDFEKESESW
ncbi:hypothetical protein BH09BAC1_BH09BAC1_09800 [soil metagenome]